MKVDTIHNNINIFIIIGARIFTRIVKIQSANEFSFHLFEMGIVQYLKVSLKVMVLTINEQYDFRQVA